MAINDDLIRMAISELASVKHVMMDPDSLVEDAVMLAESFPNERDYLAAVLATKRALELVVAGKASSAMLRHNQEGWLSYHYQHSVAQGAQADCRLEWQKRDGEVYVRGFGHRWLPVDFYTRMAKQREEP